MTILRVSPTSFKHALAFLLASTLLGAVIALSLWSRPRPRTAKGPVYSVQQVETLLIHGPGLLAGQTIRVRALRLSNCPGMQGGASIWYTCELIPASLAPALRSSARITLPSPLVLWAEPPDSLRIFLHNVPVIGGAVPVKDWNNDFDPKIYRIALIPSRTCNTGGLGPCPKAEYLGPEP